MYANVGVTGELLRSDLVILFQEVQDSGEVSTSDGKGNSENSGKSQAALLWKLRFGENPRS